MSVAVLLRRDAGGVFSDPGVARAAVAELDALLGDLWELAEQYRSAGNQAAADALWTVMQGSVERFSKSVYAAADAATPPVV